MVAAGMNMNVSPTLGVTSGHHVSNHSAAVAAAAAMMSHSNGIGGHSNVLPSPPYPSNGLNSPDKSLSPTNGYEYTHQRGLGSPQSPSSVNLHSPTSLMPALNGLPVTPPSAQMPPSPPQVTCTASHLTLSGVSAVVTTAPHQHHSHPQQQKTSGGQSSKNSTISQPASASSSADEVEEINTKELAQRISAELKRYSIPQAIFAQRVLCRSQGTLSDLLRNPKPWSKLKSGRETFRRMYKWLEEPEFQRMSALRLAGERYSKKPLFALCYLQPQT
ncbi:Hepatocyte nuclear factor 6-like protein [Leptotrombidium deliense]|uniref:Hepatocyte nuclear factor 6-like protein n=1 Tax=Leptotrombidium deliense TaxID=299467 RepID=A0A443SC21_9ACAR|nr:Hepatocyte nuclear factor 6-like protein [Leptotrombidium deliense]